MKHLLSVYFMIYVSDFITQLDEDRPPWEDREDGAGPSCYSPEPGPVFSLRWSHRCVSFVLSVVAPPPTPGLVFISFPPPLLPNLPLQNLDWLII